MSNQEQQFYTPDRYPPQSPSHEVRTGANIDPREQEGMYGAAEYYTGAGQKLQPRRRQPKRRRIFWLLPLVLLLLIGGIGYRLGSGSDSHWGKYDSDNRFGDMYMQNHVYTLSTPKFIIDTNAGHVHIHSDSDSTNTVTVHISKSNKAEPDPIVQQDGNTVTIKAIEQNFTNDNVDIDITTPKTSDIQLHDSNGDVDISTVTGTINANVTNGRISADHITGQASFSSTNGDVSVRDSSLSGASTLQSTDGSVEYNGTLDAQGTYKLTSVNGDVRATLPENTAFHITHHTNNGQYHNDFGNEDNGSGTRPTLTLETGNGSIEVHKS